MKRYYIKACLEGDKSGLIVDREGGKAFIDELLDNYTDKYTLETVEMTEDEFKSLPEFQGF